MQIPKTFQVVVCQVLHCQRVCYTLAVWRFSLFSACRFIRTCRVVYGPENNGGFGLEKKNKPGCDLERANYKVVCGMCDPLLQTLFGSSVCKTNNSIAPKVLHRPSLQALDIYWINFFHTALGCASCMQYQDWNFLCISPASLSACRCITPISL